MALYRKGSKGSGVKDVQQWLLDNGYSLPKYGADGTWGSETEAAVRKAQSDLGVVVDGVWGPKTQEAADSKVAGGDEGTGDEDTGPLALPRGARLIRVGSDYRVIWDLPDDLGTVWYSINTKQLANIYGDDWESDVTEVYSNTGSYSAKYGDAHWGNIAEVDINSENPWQDMYQRILTTFGFVAGMDTNEIRNLIVQAYFEDWTSNEFFALYRQTDYYNSRSDVQRAWSILSDAEKESRIQGRAGSLVSFYNNRFGLDPEGGIGNAEILASAMAIESGVMTIEEWEYNTRKTAEGIEGSPASREVDEEKRAKGQKGVTIENFGSLAEEEWRRWVGGAVPIPNNFGMEWGNWLFMNERSEADLETHLKNLAATYYPDKDPNVSWTDWSAIPKSYIQSILELPSINDDDKLLDIILKSGATGYDMRILIKNDPRYMQTKGALSELSSKAHSIGTMMGFIPGGDI